MKPNLCCFIIFTFFLVNNILAQDKSEAKFGKISAKDFEPKVYSIDSSADAVIIADIGSSFIQGSSRGGVELVYKHYRRVHILNKNGYDIANVTISLYKSDNTEESLDKLRAVTYNIENGKVIETKLDGKSGVFKENVNKNQVAKKFTMPNIKEGSIIEYEYIITSQFLFNFQPWRFQGAYPRLWSEYEAEIPQFYDYLFLAGGYRSFHIRKTDSRQGTYHINVADMSERSDIRQISCLIYNYRWVMKDVPALKEEPYTSSIENHIAKIEFQLSGYRYPLTPYDVMGNWTKVGQD